MKSSDSIFTYIKIYVPMWLKRKLLKQKHQMFR